MRFRIYVCMSNAQLALRPRKTHLRKHGRRSLFTAALQKRICQLLAKGNTIVAVCDHVGISEATFHQWCEARPEFLESTSRARGKARVRHVQTLTKAAEKDWRASAWLLSHCWPQEYSETSRHEIGVAGRIVFLPQKDDGRE
jgi:terminase small subunit-like protein